MIRALVWKELRETAGICAGFLVVALIYISRLMDWKLFAWLYDQTMTPDNYAFYGVSATYAIIAGAFAMILGFRQSAIEPARGTTLYLFHRPIARRKIMLVKLATGICLVTLASCLPLFIYAVWAATPGNLAEPFEWSMTSSSFQIVAMLPVVYLAAFSSGNYGARWIGARLLPLLAGIIPFGVTQNIPRWWMFGLPMTALCCAWFVANILLETRTRDF